jgi:hypothetical protein
MGATFHTIIKHIWNVIFVIIYPVITTFSLIFVGVIFFFSTLSKLIARIPAPVIKHKESEEPQWKEWAKAGHFAIEQKFADEIMFGPSYYRLKANPRVEDLERNYFGDFVFYCFGGVLLQRWNTTNVRQLPDYSLVFLHGQTGKIIDLGKINSFSWKVAKSDDDTVQIKWFNGAEGGTVIIKEKDVI